MHADPVNAMDPTGLFSAVGTIGASSIGGQLRGLNLGAVQGALRSAGTEIGKSIGKSIAFNAASYFFFQRQMNEAKEELALLALEISGLSIPDSVKDAFTMAYQTYQFFAQPAGAAVDILNVPLVRTAILTGIGQLPDPIGKYARWASTGLKGLKYGRAILGAAVGIPLLVEASERLFTAMGYRTQVDFTSSWKPGLMGLQVAWGALYEHGAASPVAGMRVVSMPQIVRNMRQAVRASGTYGGQGVSTAIREYVEELNFLFGGTLNASTDA